MLHENVNLFKKLYNAPTRTQSLAFVWDFTQNTMKVSGPRERFKATLICHVHTFLTVLIVLQIFYGFFVPSNGVHSMLAEIQIGFSIFALPTTNFYLNICKIHTSEVVLFLNGLPSHKDIGIRKSFLEKLNIMFARILRLSLGITPLFFVFGSHWFIPCNGSLAFYFLLDECSALSLGGIFGKIWKIVEKFSIFFLNYWIWMIGFDVTAFAVGGLHILCTISLRSHLHT